MFQPEENHLLDHGEVADLVTDLYNFVQQNPTENVAGNLVGLKDPHTWDKKYVGTYRRYFPRTKIVFGLRHPVTWFNR